MKNILALLFLLNFSLITFGQVGNASCDAPDSVRAAYARDAAQLTYKYMYDYQLPDTANVWLPQIYLDTFMDALLAVYNSDLPQADTVVNVYNIHHYPIYSLESINVGADSTVSWMQQLRAGNIPTGNATLDSMMDNYGLSLTNYYDWPSSFGYHSVVFYSDNYLNTKVLANKFEDLPGIHYAEVNGYMGDGHKIFASIHEGYILLNFLGGWGDCPVGCTYHFGWQFKVYDDCSVEFVRNIYTGIGDLELDSFGVYPNPFVDYVELKDNGLVPNFSYQIYDIQGRLVKQGRCVGSRISGLDNLPKGIFILKIPSRQPIKILKI